jgi:hypothetical protein
MRRFPWADEFKEWLEKQPEDKRWPCTAEQCPLADFLSEWYERKMVVGLDYRYMVIAPEMPHAHTIEGVPHPIWAARFVYKFDDSNLVKSPKVVLRILAGARRGLKRS